MRRPLLFCLPLLSVLLWQFSVPPGGPSPYPAPPGSSVVEWQTETDHDFGEIRAGSLTRFVFKFKNIDSQPIVVETVRTTCGCTAAQWPTEPVPPGATGDIVIEYDSEKKGSFRKKIRVFFDRQKRAEILFVAGEVVD